MLNLRNIQLKINLKLFINIIRILQISFRKPFQQQINVKILVFGIINVKNYQKVVENNNLLNSQENIFKSDKKIYIYFFSASIEQNDFDLFHSSSSKNGYSQKHIDEIIRKAQDNNEEIDIIKILLNQQKVKHQYSQNHSLKSQKQIISQILIQRFNCNPSDISVIDSCNQLPTFKFNYSQKKSTKIRKLRIKIISIFEQDNEQSIQLLIMIKNISSKSNLNQLKQDVRFQSSLLNSFSHELRTPLNCSLQMLQVAKDYLYNSKSSVYTYVNQAIMSNKLLMYQLNDILDLSAMQNSSFHYQFNKIALKEIIEEIESIYYDACESKRIKFSITDKSNLQKLPICTDKGRILQILVNLLNNSIKFTREEGIIEIRLKMISPKNIKIQVRDNGIGINKFKLENIQEMMKNAGKQKLDFLKETSKANIGLGLRISTKIVEGLIREKQINSLEIKSVEKKGTKVTFYFEDMPCESEWNIKLVKKVSQEEISEIPESLGILSHRILNGDLIGQQIDDEIENLKELNLKLPKQSRLFFEQPISQESERNCDGEGDVLIVDDIPFNQMALKLMLIHHKIKPDQAYDGFQAVQKVKEKKSKNQAYKLIFMDIEMPGIDGFKTTKEVHDQFFQILDQIWKILKNFSNSTNIIMCSAYDTEENFEKAKQVGMVDFITKPVSKSNLEKVIDKYYKNNNSI